MTYKLRALLQLDCPKAGSRTEFVVLSPRVISVKLTRNNHLTADEMTVTIGYKEGGVDPRMMKDARGALWLWDANREDWNSEKHLRFTGVCTTPVRRLASDGWVVELTFHDYTALFIDNKPLATSGMPEWADTLQAVWERICDNTGWEDPSNGKILSNVVALRDNLVFESVDFAERPLGQMVNERFHKISKPTPRQGASSWDVWQWCVASLGLISFIDKDQCIVTDTTEHFSQENAAYAVYGENIHTLEERGEPKLSSRGILLKSFDPLQGRALEAFYPPPGDARLKTRKAAAKPKSDGGVNITANEVSGDFDEYNRYDITDQAALDRCAREAYLERFRQELHGSFKTAELLIADRDGRDVDVLDLRAGDAINIIVDPELNLDVLLSHGGEEERVRYLVDRCNYDEDVARLIAKNIDNKALRAPTFHISSVELDLGPDRCEVEVKFHNLIITND